MKTLTQVVLPIAVIAGLVFGITWIMNYSNTNPSGGSSNGVSAPKPTEIPPLKFVHLTAKRDPNVPDLRDWDDYFEMGTEGHFDFWFRNVHEQEVTVTAQPTCTCSGVDLLVVPPQAWNAYLKESALAGWPGLPASPVLAAVNLCQLQSQFRTHPLAAQGKQLEGSSVPAASSPANPQMGIARVNFKAKNEPKFGADLKVTITSKLPGQNGNAAELKLYYNVVSPYVMRSQEDGLIGELRAGSVIERDVVVLSYTRPELKLQLASADKGDQKDCIEWSEPVPFTPEERQAFMIGVKKEEAMSANVKSGYHIRVKVYERREVVEKGQKVLKQLDLGPVMLQLRSVVPDLPDQMVYFRGTVRGDLRILTDREVDRIDFGASFPSRDSRTKQVTLVSDRKGLELELLKDQCTPEYLDVSLQPQKEVQDGKKWTLSVRIPEGRLYSHLENSYVVLRTKDSPPRRFRIPVTATTFN